MTSSISTRWLVAGSPQDCDALCQAIAALRDRRIDTVRAATAVAAQQIARFQPPACVVLFDSLPDRGVAELLADLYAEHGTGAFASLVVVEAGRERAAADALRRGAQEYAIRSEYTPRDLAALAATTEDRWRSEIAGAAQDTGLALETLTVGVISTDMRGMIVGANGSAGRLLGLAPGSIVGRRAWQILPWSDAAAAEQELRHALHTRSSVRFEAALAGDRWLAISVQPSERGLTIQIGEISAWQHTERSLHAVEAFQRSLIASSQDCLMVLDTDARLTWISDTGLALLEIRDFSTVQNSDWRQIWMGQDHERARAAVAAARRGESARFQALASTATGTARWWDVSVTPVIGASGAPTELLAVLRDITDRVLSDTALRESERRFRLLSEGNVAGVVFADTEGGLSYVNDAYLAIIGYTREEFDRGMVRWDDLTPPEWLPVDQQAISELREYGHTSPYEKEYLRRDGRRVPVLLALAQSGLSGADEVIGTVIDLTERKYAEQALRESQIRLQAALAAGNIGTWRYDASGGGMTHHAGLNDMLGFGAHSTTLTLSEWLDLVVADDRARVAEALNRVVTQGGSYDVEYRYAHPDGSLRWLRAQGRRSDGERGAAVAVIGATADITRLKETEERAYQREQELSTLVSNIPDVITRFDRELRHVYVSPAGLRATGRAPDEFIGRTNREMGMPEALCDLWDRHLRAAFESGTSSRLEFSMDTASGVNFFESLIIPEVQPSGRIDSVMSLARDVTATKRATERLRFLSEASVALASSLDYETTITQVARLAVPTIADWSILTLIDRAQRLIRHVVAADADGAALAAALSGTYPLDPAIDSELAASLAHGTARHWDEIPAALLDRLTHTPQQTIELQQIGLGPAMVVPLLHGDEVLGLLTLARVASRRGYDQDDVLLAQEIAQRATLAIDQARLYLAAQEAIREREDFISIAAHELGNPLTSVLGRAEMLKRRLERSSADESRDLRDARVILEQTQRTRRLLSELFDVARVDSSLFTLDRRPCDLGALVRRVVSEVQTTTVHHPIIVRGDHHTIMISGDDGRIDQVMRNLLSNAIKYSPNGGTIMVSLDIVGEYARIVVMDRGLGIPEDAQQHLFRRFYRINSSATSGIRGSGIGLYVVKEIVSRHGGSITVRSVEGEGSTFTVLLPLLSSAAPTLEYREAESV